jgi:hypothetical protein
MLPIAASQAGVPGGAAWQELVVKLTHIAAGLGLVIACRFCQKAGAGEFVRLR